MIPPNAEQRDSWLRAYVHALLYLAPDMGQMPRVVVRYRKGKRPPGKTANTMAGTILGHRSSGPHPSHEGCSILLVQTEVGVVGMPVHRETLERPLSLRGGFRDRSREFRFPDVTEAHFGGKQAKVPRKKKVGGAP